MVGCDSGWNRGDFTDPFHPPAWQEASFLVSRTFSLGPIISPIGLSELGLDLIFGSSCWGRGAFCPAMPGF